MAFIPLVLAVLAAAAHVSATCNADNCYRGLSGSAHAASATAFCGSYMAPSFTGTIPTYASACSNSAARLSSACNCLTAAIATTTSSSGSTSATSTSSTTIAIVSPTTSTTGTSSSSTSVSTTLSTSITAGSTCKITRTHTVLTTTTSTVTATYSPYPIDVVPDSGFEDAEQNWSFTNGNAQQDGADTPAHSGFHSAQLNAVGPTLPDGSDAIDASVQANHILGVDVITGLPNPGGYFLLSMYVYVLSATSSDDTDPFCELSVSIGDQEVITMNIVPETVWNQYRSFYQWVDLDNTRSVVVDLSCSPSSDVGRYSATVLVDDLYLYSGPYVQCGGQQR